MNNYIKSVLRHHERLCKELGIASDEFDYIDISFDSYDLAILAYQTKLEARVSELREQARTSLCL